MKQEIPETWSARKTDDESRHLKSCQVCRERLRPREDQKLYAVKNARTRQFVHVFVNGKSLEDTLGWPKGEILYAILKENGAPKGPPMSEEVKAKLREANKKRREENKLKRQVRANTPARLVEGDKEQKMSTKKRSKKTKAAKGDSKRGSIFVFNLPATSVVRWMGKDGFSLAEAMAALKEAGVSKMPTDACIRTFLYAGKKGERGEPAKLTAEQQKILRDAAKAVEKKAEKTEKKEAAAA